MRANKIINYTSILQVLGESGCPFCRFMKDVQAATLQKPGGTSIDHLCNFHTWGLAAMQRAPLAADLLLRVIDRETKVPADLPCDMRLMLWDEEDLRIREFIRYRKQLMEGLEKLRDDYKSDTANWGLLGHAAEFLASQRGLHT